MNNIVAAGRIANFPSQERQNNSRAKRTETVVGHGLAMQVRPTVDDSYVVSVEGWNAVRDSV